MRSIFIHIPKTGGRSLVTDLGFDQILSDFRTVKMAHKKLSFGHVYVGDILNVNKSFADVFENSFKFAIVRNPYERCVSLFFYIKYTQLGKKIKHDEFEKYKNEFKTFCKRLNSVTPIGLYNVKNDSQANKQTSWVTYKGANFCDYIGKFEKYDESVKYIASKLKIKLPDKLSNIHENKTQKDFNYMDFYDEQSAKHVYSYYEVDFENFGYNEDIAFYK